MGKLSPSHPGEILMEEFLKPMGISQYRLSKDISVHPRRINEIVTWKSVNHSGYGVEIIKIFRDVGEVLD